jgi:hypothetical protein
MKEYFLCDTSLGPQECHVLKATQEEPLSSPNVRELPGKSAPNQKKTLHLAAF